MKTLPDKPSELIRWSLKILQSPNISEQAHLNNNIRKKNNGLFIKKMNAIFYLWEGKVTMAFKYCNIHELDCELSEKYNRDIKTTSIRHPDFYEDMKQLASDLEKDGY